ncbi:MAG: nitronate monooxygenase [Rudaea sp.]
MKSSREFLDRLGITIPIIQAPMAGVSTPAMAAAVSNAGALGSIGVGATDVEGARNMIAQFRQLSDRGLNVNVFCHRAARPRPDVEAAWVERLRAEFERVEAQPPAKLNEIYQSFVENEAMLSMLVEEKPSVVSFHFGLPPQRYIDALMSAGIVLLGCATSLHEAKILAASGIHAVVAQGYEAGGHRGVFDADARDDQMTTMALTRVLVRELDVPIIAAGGIMDGAGISAALRLGASAAQLGTAFIACDESQADAGFRAALFNDAAHHTRMTRAISGRPARCLANKFTELGERIPSDAIPDYPIAYDAGKSLHAAAKAKGEFGFGAQWAGQGAPMARKLSSAQLIAELVDEIGRASSVATIDLVGPPGLEPGTKGL